MTTAIAIEDVRREVKILKALSGHKHLVKFHDACEDANNVYIVMEYVSYLLIIIIYMEYLGRIFALSYRIRNYLFPLDMIQ